MPVSCETASKGDLHFEIPGNVIRDKIFNPVLDGIYEHLDLGLQGGQRSKNHILFSGFLAECQYVHDYMSHKFARFASVLGSSDE